MTWSFGALTSEGGGFEFLCFVVTLGHDRSAQHDKKR